MRQFPSWFGQGGQQQDAAAGSPVNPGEDLDRSVPPAPKSSHHLQPCLRSVELQQSRDQHRSPQRQLEVQKGLSGILKKV